MKKNFYCNIYGAFLFGFFFQMYSSEEEIQNFIKNHLMVKENRKNFSKTYLEELDTLLARYYEEHKNQITPEFLEHYEGYYGWLLFADLLVRPSNFKSPDPDSIKPAGVLSQPGNPPPPPPLPQPKPNTPPPPPPPGKNGNNKKPTDRPLPKPPQKPKNQPENEKPTAEELQKARENLKKGESQGRWKPNQLAQLPEDKLIALTPQEIGNFGKEELSALLRNPKREGLTLDQLQALVNNRNKDFKDEVILKGLIKDKEPKKETPSSLPEASSLSTPEEIQKLDATQLKKLATSLSSLNEEQLKAIQNNPYFKDLEVAIQLQIPVLLRRSAIANTDDTDDNDEWE